MGDGSDLRPGEVRLDLPPPGDAQLRFIGHIETPFITRDMCPRQGNPESGPDCALVLDAALAPGLQGLEAYDWAEVLYWLDRSRRDLIVQNPKQDGRLIGTFALRSPVRPNPIGLSRVRVLGIDGARVRVRGLDCLNGTPLVDLKPDRCSFTPKAPPKPGAE